MSEQHFVELELLHIRFYSEYDEQGFFDWINKLTCIEKIFGQGETLFVVVNNNLVDEYNFREILSLFHRYNINKRQLTLFDKDEFAVWFRDPNSYWYKEIFDPDIP